MKILILNNLISYTYNFRKEIIEAFVERGYEVVLASDNDDSTKLAELESFCRFIPVPFNGKGKNIIEELRLIRTYRKIVRDERPDIILTFTIKMNLYGGLAAKRYHTAYVPMITGLGELEKEGKLRALLMFLHRSVMPYAKTVVFQNEDNRRFFDEHGIRYMSSVVVPGSGINLEKFAYAPYPEGDIIHFAFLGRLIKAKGIGEYLDAAENLASEKLVFHAAGPVDSEFRERVDSLASRGKLIYEGVLSDTRAYLAFSSALVLPTYHPEGLSNVILEASAVGRPVICTPRTGCREIVSDGINGFYCREKDSGNLVSVIRRFASLSKEKREVMGRKGRRIVEEKFDRKRVISAYLGILES